MSKVRTFIAVLLSDELKNKIASVQDKFKNVVPGFKWVAPDNLHVTVKFLGSVEEERLDEVYRAVRRTAVDVPPFELRVAGAWAFPNPRRPRILWVCIENGGPELSEIAARVDAELEADGFPREEKEFKAHITIGRAGEGGRVPDLSGAIGERNDEPLGAQMVECLSVMRSELLPLGPIYSRLREVELAGVSRG